MDRAFSIGAGPRCKSGPFAFSGKLFQAKPFDATIWPSPEFRFEDAIGLVGLRVVDRVSPDRVRHEIRELQSGRIMLLVHNPNIKVGHLAQHVLSVTDSAELQ